MLRRIVLYLVFVSAMIFAPTSVYAQCSVSLPNINFGNVDVSTGTAVNVTGSLGISCTNVNGNNPGSRRFCISIGSGSVFTGSQRQLGGPSGSKLDYDLYQDSARTQLWGSWQTGFDTAGLQIDLSTDGSGNISASVPVYARLFANQQSVLAGSYSSAIPSGSTGLYLSYTNGNSPCDTGNSSATSSFSVLGNVIAACSISASNISFGTVGFLASNVDATSTVTAQCNVSVPYTVSLSGGNAAAADPTQRKMAKAAETVTYGLYRDAGRSQPWGSIVGTDTVAGTGTGAAQNITVYGRVPPQVTGSPGNYSDTIVATITY